MTTETIIKANGVELAVETFGTAGDPALLLVSGTSMLAWDGELCARLADGGRYVLRYDLRDQGRSVTYPAGSPTYTLRDLAADAVGVLDAFELPTAHVAGVAVGGWVAQLAALDHAERLASLTLLSTRPTAHGRADADLPEHSAEVMAFLTTSAPPDWSDRASTVEYLVSLERACSAGSRYFDEPAARAVAEHTFDRAVDMAASFNIASTAPGPRWRGRLGKLTMPTLVVHGTEDGFFPYGNAVALAAEIPGARLLPLDGVGHELPRAVWDTVVPAVLEHTAG